MEEQLRVRLQQVLSKHDSEMQLHDLRFLRARASYLSNDQIDRLNHLLEGTGIDPVNKKKLSKKRTIVDVPSQEEVVAPAAPVVSEPTEEVEVVDDSDEDPDMPEDSGELEVVDDDEETDEVDSEGDDEDVDEVDLDEMNLDQLKGVAKDLGIAGSHFYKDADKLRKKILETYETSNEAAEADQLSADSESDEVTEE